MSTLSTSSQNPSSKYRKSRSSVVFCKEKYACLDEKARAEFECEDCKTSQCADCEQKLHQLPKFVYHDRRKRQPPPADQLCQGNLPICTDSNFADVTCESCQLNLCFDCDTRVHQKLKKLHKRNPFIKVLPGHSGSLGLNELLLPKNEPILSVNKPPFVFDHNPKTEPALLAVKPLSPLSYNDDSLTFLSLPQHDNTDSNVELCIDMSKDKTEQICATIFSREDVLNSAYRQNNFDVKQSTKLKSDLTQNSAVGKSFTKPASLSDKLVDKSDPKQSSIPDIAVMLPCNDDDDGERNDSFDVADIIADSLQRSIIDGPLSYSISVPDGVSFPLANQQEELLVKDESDFITQLGCEAEALIKVVSIFGNTGDGKSYSLNHAFFEGKEIFKTSSQQTSCTAGVWAAYDAVHNAIMLDTEGLLGISSNQNQRTRLLLKILAISDIIIYRTRAERLHSDLFQFLGDASKAYLKHFCIELKSASKRFQLDSSVSTLGPSVIIFHETLHTAILAKGASEPAEKYIRDRFRDLGLDCDAFSSIQYVGTQTTKHPTDFKGLLLAVKKQLRNNDVRCARNPAVVFRTLKILNEKFTGDIDKEVVNMFPDQYFTCRSQCLACNARCSLTMNHCLDSVPHEADQHSRCKHQAQFDNTIYTCKACYKRGQTVVVVPKTSASTESSWMSLANYAWSGYVLECANCGVIYRSRQHWYGNPEPEKTVVRTEIRHVWPGGNPVLQGTHNAARRLLDGLNYVSDSIAVVGAKPAKAVSSWVTDKIAPPYWEPNAEITHCRKCEVKFDEKILIHHCRACGKGFCANCSSKKRPVPERNWGTEPVRVCDICHDASTSKVVVSGDSDNDTSVEPSQLMPRKVGEAIGSTVGALATIVNYPLVAIRDAARPAYWIPDEEINSCFVCNETFSSLLKLHHCRACGQGVCSTCSPNQRAVRSRGWDHPVRVCNLCYNRKEL